MMTRSLIAAWARHPAAAVLVAAGAVALACTGTLDVSQTQPPGQGDTPDASTSPPTPTPEIPFEPVSVRVYVTKVKNLMLGLPPSDDEIAAVTKDPAALRGLVDAWFVRPEAQAKLGNFFKKAFQQTQISQNDFFDQIGTTQLGALPMFTQAQESMSRTALKAIADGRPFSDTVTTHTFMMTPMLMSMYLAMDQAQVDDAGKVTMSLPAPDGSLVTAQNFYVTYRAQGGPIPLSETMDPNSPNFMHFAAPATFSCTMPKVDNTGHVLTDMNGKAITMVVPYTERKYTTVTGPFLALFGYATRDFVADPTNPNGPPSLVIPSDVLPAQKPLYHYNCGASVQFTSPNSTADDSVWRPVTVRAPNPGEKLTPFYDLVKLRQANEIVVRTPRVGFFSTPAFFSNWTTNKSNQHRDTLNQALIVGVGRSINPVDKGTSTVLDNGKDGIHSDPTSPCYSCHQTMDPMRNVFRQAFSYSYHSQHDPTQLYSTASFDYLGETAALASLDDFASALVKHPLYPVAWAQKVCFYANSSACSEDDPEFQRITKLFAQSNFDFHALVRELLSSPLVTGASTTKTWRDLGETVSISRQDHFCSALTNRLQLATSLCTGITNNTTAVAVANNIPYDGYLRGAEAPALSTDQTPFFRGATESLCSYAADVTVDKTNSRYASAKKDSAITDFVANIMGITASDPNNTALAKALSDHYDAAVKAGATPTDSLKSTFITACLSPTSVAMGL